MYRECEEADGDLGDGATGPPTATAQAPEVRDRSDASRGRTSDQTAGVRRAARVRDVDDWVGMVSGREYLRLLHGASDSFERRGV